uniref:BPTI/Kunitz inhibitor domain-containing protein n=1 Tax=Varanus komodoensis TaxID=61221 RepID=A0A8D2Q0D5_VARKO
QRLYLCKLPAVTGPCKARLEVFFFNWATRRCEIFIYGGCYGNLNQFGSERECLRICGAYAVCPKSSLSLFLLAPNCFF